MKVIISGPPRSGKTTLAQQLSPLLNLPYISLSPSQVFSEETLDRLKEEYSYDPNDHPYNLRLFAADPDFASAFQDELLRARINKITSTENFITDRGFLDSWVYYTIEAAHQQSSIISKNFLVECFRNLDLIDLYVLIHPHGKPIDETKTSSVNNVFYAKSLDAIYKLYFDSYIVPRARVHSLELTSADHASRMESIKTAYQRILGPAEANQKVILLDEDIPGFARIRVNARQDNTLKAKCIEMGLENIPSKCGCHFFSYLSFNEIRSQLPQVKLNLYPTNAQKMTAVREYPFTCPKTGLVGQLDWAYTYGKYPALTSKLYDLS